MADASDSVSSWPGFVDQLNRTFMLVRDVFGYTFPGGVFFVVGLTSRKVSLCEVSCLLWPYQPRGWVAFFLAVWAAYIMGHILVAIVYTPIDLLKVIYVYKIKNTVGECKEKYVQKLEAVPTEVTSQMLTIREDHPGFFSSLDRRETMAMLAGGTGGALVIGAATFCDSWDFTCKMFVLIGILLLLDFVTAMPHLQRVREAIIKADEATKPKATPDPCVKQALADLVKAVTDVLGKI